MVTPGPRYRKINRPAETADSEQADADEATAGEATLEDGEPVAADDDGSDHDGADEAFADADDAADSDRDLDGEDDEAPTAFEVRMATYEDEVAERRRSTIANARRKGGVAGAAMAGAMIAVKEIIEAPKEDAPVVVEANSDPEDFESDGITVRLEGTEYHAPPLEPVDER